MMKQVKDLQRGERFFIGPNAQPDPDAEGEPAPHWADLRLFRKLATPRSAGLPDDTPLLVVWCDQVDGCPGSTGLLLYPIGARVMVQPPPPAESPRRTLAGRLPRRTGTLEEMAEVLAAVLVCALYWPVLLWAGGVL